MARIGWGLDAGAMQYEEQRSRTAGAEFPGVWAIPADCLEEGSVGNGVAPSPCARIAVMCVVVLAQVIALASLLASMR